MGYASRADEPLPHGPYANEGRYAVGHAWPQGHPGELPYEWSLKDLQDYFDNETTRSNYERSLSGLPPVFRLPWFVRLARRFTR